MTDAAANTGQQQSMDTSLSDIPMAVVRECARIKASDGVVESSVVFNVGKACGAAGISFIIETETLVLESDGNGLLDEEPLLFRWNSVGEIGRSAPSVRSARGDFPRYMGHLNPVHEDMPASLCLARVGLQPIYDRWGIEGVMTRLRSWLRDAKTGDLMRDGWDPVPVPSDGPLKWAFFDAKKFQELAATRREGGAGAATGVARIGNPDNGAFLVLNDASVFSADSPQYNSALYQEIDRRGRGDHVPWLFLWSDALAPTTDPVFGDWRTLGELREGLRLGGMGDNLSTAVGHILTGGCKCTNATGRRVLAVIVGIWRPRAILPNMFGLSEDGVARCLELKAFWVDMPIAGNFLDDSGTVMPVAADPVPSPELLRWTSGTPSFAPVGLIGCGALGSAVGEHLLRSGVDDIRVVEHDLLRPHNLARHAGRTSDIYVPKGAVLERLAKDVAASAFAANISTFAEDVNSISDEILAENLKGARLIIDATADERVRGRLATFCGTDGRQIVRTEIYNRGHLGVQFVTGQRNNPDLLDLYYLLCREALEIDAVADWLHALHSGGADADELLFGFGCASLSTRMPGWVVSQHAAAFMPIIIKGLCNELASGIGLNVLDESFHPAGWRWLEAAPMDVFAPPTAPDWSVHVAPAVGQYLKAERTAALPNETGGYLYGGWDAALKRIVVVEATGLPPGSKPEPGALKLGPAGQSPAERRILHRTRGRLDICGTWHSHPDSNADMSSRDRKTIDDCRVDDVLRGVPTLLMVVAEGDIRVHLQAL